MMYKVIAALLVACLAGPVAAQEAPAAEAPTEQIGLAEMLRQMGAAEEDIMKLQLMSHLLGDDASSLLLLMMMQGDGGRIDDGGLMAVLLIMKAMAANRAAGPVALIGGDRLFIVEDGTVYVLDTATLKVETSVQYRPPKKAAGLPVELLPMFRQAREKALATSCLSNMKQLCLAALMYAQDWDEVLPGEEWAEQLQPYLNNPEVYKCPAAPDRDRGFVLNEALAGAKLADIPRPAEVPLFFESSLPDDIPFGGADGLLIEPRHAGGVTVGFVDGHAKLMKPEDARRLLQKDPFR